MKQYPNPIPGIINNLYHYPLLYGNLIGGLELTVAKANNTVVAYNTITVGEFLGRAQLRYDFKADMHDRFVSGIVS